MQALVGNCTGSFDEQSSSSVSTAELEGSGDFEVVSSYNSQASSPTPKVAPSSRRNRNNSAATPGASAELDIGLRERAATETGLYFRRCLSGERRGPSGRDLVNLAPFFYVVVQEFNGPRHERPILCYTNYRAVLQLVQNPARPGDFGTSIFAGFHEEWEARLAVSTAGLLWLDHTD